MMPGTELPNAPKCLPVPGRNVLESPLVYEKGVYSIDFQDLERKLADPQTTLMLLCNPHNRR